MSNKLDKPFLERISHSYNSSILVKRYTREHSNTEPIWHFHPEMEIVYINGGSGKRQIGNHYSFFRDGDLIFIGANLPHYGFTDNNTGYKCETVVQADPDLLGDTLLNLPEMSQIRNLFEKSRKGIVFNGKDKIQIGEKVEELYYLHNYERLMAYINILYLMAEAKDYSILNVDGYAIEILPQDTDRMNIIYKFIRENYTEHIPLEKVADQVSMTVPAFCRYFKKISKKTFTEFANEYRLVNASKMLLETGKSVSEICAESGFNNFSHFNKLFKRLHGVSPREYRSTARRMMVGD